MIKLVLILAFYALLMFPAIASGAQEVTLRFPPFQNALVIPLGYAMWLFATYGGVAVVIVALIDRLELKRQHKKAQKRADELGTELENLRRMMTLERDPE